MTIMAIMMTATVVVAARKIVVVKFVESFVVLFEVVAPLSPS